MVDAVNEDLHQPVEHTVQLHCDNQSAIHLTENPVFHTRTKHVKVHYHFMREKVLRGEIKVQYMKTEDQVATYSLKDFVVQSLKILEDNLVW